MPGACIACHGGPLYNGHFPEKGEPSPLLGSRFLPFDTANYLFGSRLSLTEQAQAEAFLSLNKLVRATEKNSAASPDFPACIGTAGNSCSATMRLIDGWYPAGTTTLNKSFLPERWHVDETQVANVGAAKFYREVIGTSCRTCHTALGGKFDWDLLGPPALKTIVAQTHVCGGTPSLALNASMPNALVTQNGLAERVKADPALAALMRTSLGCDAPRPDPGYPKR